MLSTANKKRRRRRMSGQVSTVWRFYVPKAIYGYCVTWLGNFFSPSPHGPYDFHARAGHRLFKNQLTNHVLPYFQARWSQRFQSVLFLIESPSKRDLRLLRTFMSFLKMAGTPVYQQTHMRD